MIGAAIGLVIRGTINDEKSILVLTGSIIPDIERPVGWVLDFLGTPGIELTEGFHSFIGVILLSFAIASFVNSEVVTRTTRFQFALIGSLSHLLMDMTMWPWPEKGLYLFYPLKIPFSLNLWWPDFVFYPLLGLCILGLSILILKVGHIRPK